MGRGCRARRCHWHGLEVGPERELGIDQLLLAVGGVEDEDAGREAHGQGEDHDDARSRRGARGQRVTGECAARAEQATEDSIETAAASKERPDDAQEQEGPTGPQQQRSHERGQGQGDGRVPFRVQDRVDPGASRHHVDDRADDEREDIEIEPLPQRSPAPLQLLASGHDLLAQLCPQRKDGREGRQDRAQDDRDQRRTNEGLGRAGRGELGAEERESDRRPENDPERGSSQGRQDRRAREDVAELSSVRATGAQQRGVATGCIGGRVGGQARQRERQEDSGQGQEDEQDLAPGEIAGERFQGRARVIDPLERPRALLFNAAADGVEPGLGRDRVTRKLGMIELHVQLAADCRVRGEDGRRACGTATCGCRIGRRGR